jgi:hypothetical protein
MKWLGRVVLMAEMHGRDLIRRHAALALLIALPLSFYLASAGDDARAPITGGIGMAFAVSGASLFSIVSTHAVDQRLVLAGYRPLELLLGRIGFLGPLALSIAAAFVALMSALSHPARIWVVAAGLAAVALQSVPFGLAVGAAVPRDLEGTLIIIGVVGVQLASGSRTIASKVLPFHGPQALIETGVVGEGALVRPVLLTAAYGLALLVVARLAIAQRVFVRRHGPVDSVSRSRSN